MKERKRKAFVFIFVKTFNNKNQLYYISFERIWAKEIIAKVHVKPCKLATYFEYTLIMVVNIS